MIRTLALTALLATTSLSAMAGDLLFADRALSSIRANHPEFDRNPLHVYCHGPTRTTEFLQAARVDQVTPRQPVVVRRIDDARCDYPFNQMRARY